MGQVRNPSPVPLLSDAYLCCTIRSTPNRGRISTSTSPSFVPLPCVARPLQGSWHRPPLIPPICIGHPCKFVYRGGVSTMDLTDWLSRVCRRCRAAKVRCLVSLRPDRCDWCIATDGECVFTPPKRMRARTNLYLHRQRPTTVPEPVEDGTSGRTASQLPSPSPSTPPDLTSARPPPTTLSDDNPHAGYNQQPLITTETRGRIVSTLASLRGMRGAPFSFVTSGDRPPFGTRTLPEESA